jgi:hypothetical protein
MKTKIFFLSLLLCSVSAISNSQSSEHSLTTDVKKDSSRLRYNLLFENAREKKGNIIISRHGNNNRDVVTIGSEISGVFYKMDNPLIKNYGVCLTLYAGSSNASGRSLHGFGWQSPIYHLWLDNPTDYKSNDIFIYYTPGISLYSKNRKFSLDLFQRLSTQIFDVGRPQTVPYKVNFHF